MKTSDLDGAALDWAVAKCEGYTPTFDRGRIYNDSGHWFTPTTSWVQAGPIIERVGISVLYYQEEDCWEASDTATPGYGAKYSDLSEVGPTALIAAMRCYVVNKLGDEVDIPKELL